MNLWGSSNSIWPAPSRPTPIEPPATRENAAREPAARENGPQEREGLPQTFPATVLSAPRAD